MNSAGPDNSKILNLQTYRNGGQEFEISLNSQRPEEKDFLATVLGHHIDNWDLQSHHMKERHGDYAKEALQIIHEELTRPEDLPSRFNCTPILTLEGGKQRANMSATLKFQRPQKRQTELILPLHVASYIKNKGTKREDREIAFRKLIKGKPNTEDKLMLGIAAVRANIAPHNVLPFYGQDALKHTIFLSELRQKQAFHSDRIEEIDSEGIILEAAAKTGVSDSELSSALTKRTLSWRADPIIYIPFDYREYRLDFGIKTAFIKFQGIAKGISEKEMRTIIYQ